MARDLEQLQRDVDSMHPVAAPQAQREELSKLSRRLAERPDLMLLDVHLSQETSALLTRMVQLLARGDGVSVVPQDQELTTQEAADMLNMSRQYLVRLVDRGDLRCQKKTEGGHRRLSLEDVIAYKTQQDRSRRSKLAELTRLSQEAGGYEDQE